MPKLTSVMTITHLWLVLICLVTVAYSHAQIPKHISNLSSGEEYNAKQFAPRIVTVAGATGVYHFGDSEGEWDFVILENKDKLIVQAWYANWAKDKYTHQDYWQKRCRTYNNATMKGSYIYFGNYKGMFTTYNEDGTSKKTLLLFADVVGDKSLLGDKADIGFYNGEVQDFYSDKELYQLSITVLPPAYFKNKSKQELKIMRNTVYAKYGYIFQAGGEMEQYFRKKGWYHAFLKDASACLTEIEQENIMTIAKLMIEK